MHSDVCIRFQLQPHNAELLDFLYKDSKSKLVEEKINKHIMNLRIK